MVMSYEYEIMLILIRLVLIYTIFGVSKWELDNGGVLFDILNSSNICFLFAVLYRFRIIVINDEIHFIRAFVFLSEIKSANT